jgi:hypothetical protein
VFGAMKGAVDGGLFVPHKPKRFPGNKAMKGKFDPKTLRRYIYGMLNFPMFVSCFRFQFGFGFSFGFGIGIYIRFAYS